MVKKNLSGNEAVAQAAIAAGVKLISGYPGTPSSEVIGSIWKKDIPGVVVEWSTNEKVAFEEAGACAWAGQRALVTMKMSGLNVVYDSMISMVYSGNTGGFVIYVCDDPGVAAGMPEQDVRGFATMS
ncbi:MAG: indolepyruvate ferredoxin oxidoreductase subunit alpha, partial [Clostridiales bacterium]